MYILLNGCSTFSTLCCNYLNSTVIIDIPVYLLSHLMKIQVNIVKKSAPKFFLFLTSFFLILLHGCEKSHLDPDLANRQLLPAPENLRAMVGNQLIRLQWDYADTTAGLQFRVFRRDSVAGVFVLLASANAPEFRDAHLANGREYAYQVQACDSRGYFSPRSTSITATPALFGMQIESGLTVVNHSLVNIALVAPEGTAQMRLANADQNEPAAWQPFATLIQWNLSPGDGCKKITAQFRDASGNENADTVLDSIRLDTQAQIFEFTLIAASEILSAGDTLQIALVARETGGQASAQIGAWSFSLYDDGTHSDHQMNDGIYETTIVIPPGMDVLLSPARGYFRDSAGNEAISATTAPITIQNPPTAVQLLVAAVTDSQAVRLSWSQNADPDFAGYYILAAKQPNIPDSAEPIGLITSQTQTRFLITNLETAQTWYFKIVVVDQLNARTGSNELSARIDPLPAPKPVFLSHPVEILPHSVTLQWTAADPANFLNYQIVRFDSTTSGEISLIRSHILENQTTRWTDTDLAARHTYQYQVRVFNQTGQFSVSNRIQVITPADVPPDAVVLAQPAIIDTQSVRLSWSRNTDSDFEAYFIYRGTRLPINLSQPPNGIINNSQETYFTDSGLRAKTTYYYTIVVVDFYNNRTASNEVSVTIQP